MPYAKYAEMFLRIMIITDDSVLVNQASVKREIYDSPVIFINKSYFSFLLIHKLRQVSINEGVLN